MRRRSIRRGSLLVVVAAAIGCARAPAAPAAEPSGSVRPAATAPPCDRKFDAASYESTLRGLRCPSANAFDRCGGRAGTCGGFRVLEEDAGLFGVTRYYDGTGTLVASQTVYFEHPGTPPTVVGTLPDCQVRDFVSTCLPGR